jgi:hypothetical protein
LSCLALSVWPSQIKILLTVYQIVSSYPVTLDVQVPPVIFALLHALR